MKKIFKEQILEYLKTLSEFYDSLSSEPLKVAICGGAALNILDIVQRTTKDIDLLFPEILPSAFRDASQFTAQYFNLKPDWINQGPLDLFRMGLTSGYFDRCVSLLLGKNIIWLITSRLDQIHFKLYASIDRASYHVQDLHQLKPATSELVQAAEWCFTHDVSDLFRKLTLDFLRKQGWVDAVKKLS